VDEDKKKVVLKQERDIYEDDELARVRTKVR